MEPSLTGGYCPAGEVPPYPRNPRLRRLYRSIDGAQRQRPSVRDSRFQQLLHQATIHIEKSGTWLQKPIEYHSIRGYVANEGDPRLTWSGCMVKLISPHAGLLRTLRGRRKGQHPRGAYCTHSTPRLEAMLTRRRRTFDRGGGAHL